jgi:hypothetical protein
MDVNSNSQDQSLQLIAQLVGQEVQSSELRRQKVQQKSGLPNFEVSTVPP